MNAGIAAFRAGNAPHIMQVFEVGTATMMSATGAIKPVYQLMKDAGEPFDPKAYLPTITGYYSTSKGDMLSFPFNSSSMVMWINKDELKKAGIEIPKTWPEVFDAARKLKAAGHSTCGFSKIGKHTSELQSRGHLVCRLLLEKKKITSSYDTPDTT